MMLGILYFVVGTTILILMVLIVLYATMPEDEVVLNKEWPRVSLLIAARNEADTIQSCLASVLSLDYPEGHLQILVADDQSTDNTADLVREIASIYGEIQLVQITTVEDGLVGKANALAQLADFATGDFYAFTDADITLSQSWLKGMVSQAMDGTAIVTGVTTVKGRRVFDKLQAIDWLFAVGMITSLSKHGVPVTSMGNNMLIARDAYEKVGGYRAVKDSIVEDYGIFRKILDQGYGFKNLYSTTVLAKSEAIENIQTLFHQRKRWMRGAVKLPFSTVMMLLLQALYFPAILALAFFQPQIALMAQVGKFSLQSAFLIIMMTDLKRKGLLRYLVLYELYIALLGPGLVLFYVWPGKVNWKGRKF